MAQNKRVSFQRAQTISSSVGNVTEPNSAATPGPKKNNFVVNLDASQRTSNNLGDPKYPSYEKKYFQNMLSRIQRTSGIRNKVKAIPNPKFEGSSASARKSKYFVGDVLNQTFPHSSNSASKFAAPSKSGSNSSSTRVSPSSSSSSFDQSSSRQKHLFERRRRRQRSVSPAAPKPSSSGTAATRTPEVQHHGWSSVGSSSTSLRQRMRSNSVAMHFEENPLQIVGCSVVSGSSRGSSRSGTPDPGQQDKLKKRLSRSRSILNKLQSKVGRPTQEYS